MIEPKPESLFRTYVPLAGIAALVVALDQWTKVIVRMNLVPGEAWAPWAWLARHARIVNSTNTGAAFGIFRDGALVFTIVAIVVSIGVIIYYPRVPKSQRALRLALALQLGGALGNLTDRLLQSGHVTDLISVGRFPVFNIADAAIFLGVVILLLSTFFEKPESEEPTTEGTAS